MLLKLLWVFNILIIVHALYRLIIEKAFIGYALPVAILLGVSFFLRKTAPKTAVLLAGLPVIVPIVALAFFFLTYIVALGARGKVN